MSAFVPVPSSVRGVATRTNFGQKIEERAGVKVEPSEGACFGTVPFGATSLERVEALSFHSPLIPPPLQPPLDCTLKRPRTRAVGAVPRSAQRGQRGSAPQPKDVPWVLGPGGSGSGTPLRPCSLTAVSAGRGSPRIARSLLVVFRSRTSTGSAAIYVPRAPTNHTQTRGHYTPRDGTPTIARTHTPTGAACACARIYNNFVPEPTPPPLPVVFDMEVTWFRRRCPCCLLTHHAELPTCETRLRAACRSPPRSRR